MQGYAVPMNFLAVLVAAVVGYAFGAVWYGALFGKIWQKLSGVSDTKPTPGAMILGLLGYLILSFVQTNVLVFTVAYFKTIGATGMSIVLVCAFLNWFGFIAPVTLGSVIYEKKPWSLWVLNNANWLITLVIMAVIVSVWK